MASVGCCRSLDPGPAPLPSQNFLFGKYSGGHPSVSKHGAYCMYLLASLSILSMASKFYD